MERINLTLGQIHILNTIDNFKCIPVEVLARVFVKRKIFGDSSYVFKIIRRLENLGLVGSYLYGNNKKVAFLTSEGLKRLSLEGGNWDGESISPRKDKLAEYFTLEHTKKIAEIYGDVSVELDNFPKVKLLRWKGDQKILCPYVYKSSKTLRNVSRNLEPDSYFELESSDQFQNYFLEYDTGKMTFAQLVMKFKRYFEYFVYGGWEEDLKQFPTVLFITKRKQEEITSLSQTGGDMQQALVNRNLFNQSKNVIWAGIGKSENLKTISSQKIAAYLNTHFIFSHIDQPWVKELLTQFA